MGIRSDFHDVKYIFDLDGTLADHSHRLHYLEYQPKEYDLYFADCIHDAPITQVIRILRILSFNHQVVIWTTRNEVVREETIEWLRRYGMYQGIHYHQLLMRAKKDRRPDHVIKRNWLQLDRAQYLETEPPPYVAFEDRERNVKMYREAGVLCLQVSDGDF